MIALFFATAFNKLFDISNGSISVFHKSKQYDF